MASGESILEESNDDNYEEAAPTESTATLESKPKVHNG